MDRNPDIGIKKKLALGTVQFGLDYGISNSKGKTTKEEVKNILAVASESGIDLLDTASSYGISEEVLGGVLQFYPGFNVVSKFPTPEKGKRVSDYFEQSLQRLNVKGLYGYIAHHAGVFIKNPEYWKELIALKEKGAISKIGYSLYTPDELKQLLDLKLIPDIIQVPFNVFDRRFEGLFSELRKLQIEIHTRSVFLQGLFFVDPDSLSPFFDDAKPALKEIRKMFSSERDLSGALLYFCLSNHFVNKVIIGVNNAEQLIQNLESMNSQPEGRVDWDKFQLINESILLPFNWPKA